MSTRTFRTAAKAVLLATLMLARGQARAEETNPGGSRTSVGGEIDLLPVALSAADGHLGGGVNLWIGRDRVRLRAVGAYLAFPPGALTPSGFEDRQLTVAAGIVDVFYRPGFSGPWLGAGLEHWWNRVLTPPAKHTSHDLVRVPTIAHPQAVAQASRL